MAWICSLSFKSHHTRWQRRPSASTSSATLSRPRHCLLTSPGGRSSGGRCTSVTAMSAPCVASLSAVARPMPFIPPAPVIRATLPSSPAIYYLLFFLPLPLGEGWGEGLRPQDHVLQHVWLSISIREKPWRVISAGEQESCTPHGTLLQCIRHE